MEKDPPLMGHTSVFCGNLEAVEGVGLVTLEVDHAETLTCLMELLHRWLKQNTGTHSIISILQTVNFIIYTLFRILSDLVLFRKVLIFSSLLVGV